MIRRLGDYFNPNGKDPIRDHFWPNNRHRTSRTLRATACCFLAAMSDPLAREMEKVRDQINHLNKTHTVALMAAEIYSHTQVGVEAAAIRATEIYHEVQKTLEIDDTIRHIPAA